MKKIGSFIFTLCISFLVFISTAKALGGEKPIRRNEAFCTMMLRVAKKSGPHAIYKSAEECNRKMIDIAWILKIPHKVCKVKYTNGSYYLALVLCQNGQDFICDYYKVIFELWEERLPQPSANWLFMSVDEYKERIGSMLNVIDPSAGFEIEIQDRLT